MITTEYRKIYRESHKEQKKAYREANKEKHKNLLSVRWQSFKNQVFNYYGNKCACCQENRIEFLTIDHINGGGHKQRKEVGRGTIFYKWIVEEDFPSGFQTLCYNCNCSKGHLGRCAHNPVMIIEEPISKPTPHQIYQKIQHQKPRKKVLEHYGYKCVCCGEDNKNFLTIDHINGGGRKHRQKVGGNSRAVYRWIIKNNYPSEFRTLCYNCNCSIGHLGYCPHEKENEIR